MQTSRHMLEKKCQTNHAEYVVEALPSVRFAPNVKRQQA